MKKLLAILLIFVLAMPAAASAVTHVSDVYVLFIDADMLNRLYNSGFAFDSMFIEFIVMSDNKTAYYSKQTWTYGERTTTDVVECTLVHGDSMSFTINFPDGSKFPAYYDSGSVCINLGGTSYFRFYSVNRFDISKDYEIK